MSRQSKLQNAAEELVRAACLDLQSSFDTKSLEDLKAAITTNHGKLDQLIKSMNMLKEVESESLEEVRAANEKMEKIHKAIIDTNALLLTTLSQQTRNQNIAWAISNVDIVKNDFQYYADGGYRQDSKQVALEILWNFRKGYGYFLPNGYIQHSYHHSEEAAKTFRDNVVSCIHKLTGVKPRLEQGKDGRYAIYYS